MEGLIVDITDRKLLEDQLQQARKIEAVGRLAGGVAHDFNNLLTIIKGYLEMAMQRCLDRPELHSDIRRIEEAADRAVTLVRQLLALPQAGSAAENPRSQLHRDESRPAPPAADERKHRYENFCFERRRSDQGRSGSDRAGHHESGRECA